MPQAGAFIRTFAVLCGLMLAACAAPEGGILPDLPAVTSPQSADSGGTARMPRDIRLGVVDMVIQRVEDSVSPEEVAAAIEPMLATAPVCMRWPALWLERVQRDAFVVRYGLMARDWGEQTSAAAHEQMDEFVAIGFLTAAPALSPDSRAVEYRLTAAGEAHFVGLLEPGRRPQFCAPAERRLVEITEMQWGQYPCGTLQVRFTHVGDAWPAWATTETTRSRLAASWPPVGEATPGVVSLSRQWYRRDEVPSGYANGSMRSLCYDTSRRVVTGNDLNLSVAPAD